MALRIRLARGGAKKRPFYRIVVADSRSPRDGRFIEKIGTYNPMLPKEHPFRLRLDEDRAKHWLSVGARPSDRVARFLGQANIIELPAIPKQTKKNQPSEKTLERRAAAEEKRKAAAAAASEAAASEAAPSEAAPAEEAPAGSQAPEGAEAALEPAAEETPAEQAAPEETPAEETKAAETPSEDAPAEAPSEEAKASAEAGSKEEKKG